jgi:Na+/melibiose symporter-like transporter
MSKINIKHPATLFSFFLFIFVFSFVFVEAAIVPASCASGEPCTFCELYSLAVGIINFLIKLATPLAVLFIAWGGIQILTASGPGSVTKGWDAIKNALIGIALVFGAWLIVNTFITFLISGNFNLPWKEFNCSISN